MLTARILASTAESAPPREEAQGGGTPFDAGRHPALWFPKARTSSVVRIGRPEVLVVLGTWRQLRKAIGAGGGWVS